MQSNQSEGKSTLGEAMHQTPRCVAAGAGGEEDYDEGEEDYDEGEWEVEELLAKRKNKDTKEEEFKVLWAGFDGDTVAEGSTSWEPASWLIGEGYGSKVDLFNARSRLTAIQNQKRSEEEGKAHARAIKQAKGTAAVASGTGMDRKTTAKCSPHGAKNTNLHQTSVQLVSQLIQGLPSFVDSPEETLNLQPLTRQKAAREEVRAKELEKELAALTIEEAAVKRIQLGLHLGLGGPSVFLPRRGVGGGGGGVSTLAAATAGGSPQGGGGVVPPTVVSRTPTTLSAAKDDNKKKKKHNSRHLNKSLDGWVSGMEQLLLRNLDLLRCLSACRWDVDHSWNEYMNPAATTENIATTTAMAIPAAEVEELSAHAHQQQGGVSLPTPPLASSIVPVQEEEPTTGASSSSSSEWEWVDLNVDSFQLIGKRELSGEGAGFGCDTSTTDGGNTDYEEDEANFFMVAPTTFYESADILLMVMSFSSSHTFFNACGVSKRWWHVGRRMHQARCLAFDASLNFRNSVLRFGLWPIAVCECDPTPKHTKSFIHSLQEDNVTLGGSTSQRQKGSANTDSAGTESRRCQGRNGGDVWPMFAPTHNRALRNNPQPNLSVFNLLASATSSNLQVTNSGSPMEHVVTFYMGRSPTQDSGGRVEADRLGAGYGCATPANVIYKKDEAGGSIDATNVPVLSIKALSLGGALFRKELLATYYQPGSNEFKDFHKIPDDPTIMLKVEIEKIKKLEAAAEAAAQTTLANWINMIEADLLAEKRALIPKRRGKSSGAEKLHISKEELASAVRSARREFVLHKEELAAKRQYRLEVGAKVEVNLSEECATSRYGVPPPEVPSGCSGGVRACSEGEEQEQTTVNSLVDMAGASQTYFDRKLEVYAEQWHKAHGARAKWEEFAFSLPAPVVMRDHAALAAAQNSVRLTANVQAAATQVRNIRTNTYQRMKAAKPVDLIKNFQLTSDQLTVLAEFSDMFATEKDKKIVARDDLVEHGW